MEDINLISLTKKNGFFLLLLQIVLTIITTLVSYNEGFKKGVHETIVTVANCSLEDAKKEKCFIPCTTNEDCLAKNGMEDH